MCVRRYLNQKTKPMQKSWNLLSFAFEDLTSFVSKYCNIMSDVAKWFCGYNLQKSTK